MRAALPVVAILCMATPAAAWETSVLTYRGIRSVSMFHTTDGIRLSFGCATSQDAVRETPPTVSVWSEATRQFGPMPGDPAKIEVTVGENSYSISGILFANDSRDTAFEAKWPELYAILPAASGLTVTAETLDGVIRLESSPPMDEFETAIREFAEACSSR